MWIATIVLTGMALIAAGWDDPHPLTLLIADFLPTLTLLPAAFLTSWLVHLVETSYAEPPTSGRAQAHFKDRQP
jgi:hypothetical protein